MREPTNARIYRTRWVLCSRRSGYITEFTDTDGFEIANDHLTAQAAFDYLRACGLTVIKWDLSRLPR